MSDIKEKKENVNEKSVKLSNMCDQPTSKKKTGSAQNPGANECACSGEGCKSPEID